MNRQMRKELKKLDEKIEKARTNRDYLKEFKLRKEREELTKLHVVKIRSTLLSSLQDYTPEERKEATVRVIYAIATADLLYGAAMEVHEILKKKFGIVELPMMDELKSIVKRLEAVVHNIDAVGSEIFSERYMEIVDAIELKYEATMKNFIWNEFQKAINQSLKKG